jgi:hypothetical protein
MKNTARKRPAAITVMREAMEIDVLPWNVTALRESPPRQETDR